jgi:AAA domain
MTTQAIPVAIPVAKLAPIKSPLPGVNVLLEGPTGTGKTTALKTLADSGLELFVLFTESGVESLAGAYTDNGKEIPPNVHWHCLPRPAASFETMAQAAQTINTSSFDALTKIQDPNRGKHNQFITLLRSLSDFPCDRTGKTYGAVDGWGTGRVLAIDSLTGINPIALSLVVGSKPVKSMSDWGIAQDQIEKLIRQLADGCRCHFVITAHVEREVDQVFGGVKITVSTLGKALAPKIPPMFSDVILSVRDGAKFSWSTAAPNADLKARNLPVKDGLPQDFSAIIARWKSRGGLIEATE